MNHEVYSDTNCTKGLWSDLQRPEKETGDQKKNQDQARTLLRSAKILRQVLETWIDFSEETVKTHKEQQNI